jgi:D-sedoheptulose 7-phosphate isomerase
VPSHGRALRARRPAGGDRAPAPARSDARHVAVEFVHPVIVGKRALPALGLTAIGPVAAELASSPSPTTSSIAFGEPATGRARRGAGARARARLPDRGLRALGAEWELEPPSDDPFVRQELVETAYHVLWELVHVFFEHRGLLEGRTEQPVHDVGASSFLYPFLGEQEHDLDAVLRRRRARRRR